MATVQFETSATPPAAEAGVDREFTVESRSQRQQIVRRFLHNKLAMTGLVVWGLVLAIAFLGPLVYKFSYDDIDGNSLSASPGTNSHILGTNTIGRDLLAMIMRGIQRSTLIAIVFVVLAGVIGILIGALAGYFGKWVDNWLMRFVDLILTVPILVIIAVVSSSFPDLRNPLGVALMIALFNWMYLARIVRSSFLSLREREYVEAAHALGASNRRIIFKHLIPNSLGPIIVWATLGAATSVILEASLTYLGYGVQGSDTSLGRLVSEGAAAAQTRPWLFYYPGLFMLIIVMSINLIGDGIRDAVDPSNNRVRA